jgi:vacuolar protein sorting-associated protein 35
MEMNKLWVRIQHLPGEGNNKDVRKRRERERNDLRILVGTNLVRLSQLECVTSKIYGEMILPRILEHIVVSGDPLSQAYLMDCLVQVFPDEYHIETLPILLNVCPRLRDKVNIRTILQGLMDRLANYLAEEELLDESDTNQVKKTLARDSFFLFEECVQKVYNARGPKLTAKEVIRLQTALLQFSVKCYPGNDSLISRCLGACVSSLRQANASYDSHDGTVAAVQDDRAVVTSLDEASVTELEKLLSIPLETLALRVLELEHYSALIGFLPWLNRREVAMNMLKAVDNAGSTPKSVKEITELFGVIAPVMRDEHVVAQVNHDAVARASSLMAGLGVQTQSSSLSFGENDSSAVVRDTSKENNLVSKLVHLLDHEDPDVVFEMLQVARTYICVGGRHRASQTLVAVVFASVKLLRRNFKGQETSSELDPATTTASTEADGEEEDESKEDDKPDTAAVDVAEEVTTSHAKSPETPSQDEVEVADGIEAAESGTVPVEAPANTDDEAKSSEANNEHDHMEAIVKADESENDTATPIDVTEAQAFAIQRAPTISR